ncbi:hypothetical protein IQ22_02721 [Pseudomonas duriflava]|uniref:Uncharacterized protein n=1 Tax=Pseudomonas duriflava TaxID=459528 RepID=A0A562Q9W1_9PSED|nr:hypothetical protein IQ22_02721 [Pseudomonas duriflava]
MPLGGLNQTPSQQALTIILTTIRLLSIFFMPVDESPCTYVCAEVSLISKFVKLYMKAAAVIGRSESAQVLARNVGNVLVLPRQ